MTTASGIQGRQLSTKATLWRQFLESTLAVAFPSPCVLCNGELTASLRGGLCANCWTGLESWSGHVCSCCGLPLAGNIDSSIFVCADCRLRQPHFDVARNYGIYAGKLRAAVLQLKFHRREHLGVRLGGLLLEPWLALTASPTFCESCPVIIPVPLHRDRERERGYNQAELLARGLVHAMRKRGGISQLKAEARAVVRRQSTVPQSGLSLHDRSENVRRAFEVVKPERVWGRDVILVDDVMTTGATASACAAVLRDAGTGRIAVLTLARATPQFPDVAPVIV
jgi:ComF family protein